MKLPASRGKPAARRPSRARYVFTRQRRIVHPEPGATPQDSRTPKTFALKARFTFGQVRFIIGGMAQSLSKVLLHIIFSTKNREPWLDSNVRPRMHAYLATICRDAGADFVRLGGVSDHVHIVTTLARTLSQAQLIEEIKKASSKWVKALDARYRGFSGSADMPSFR